jgi:GPH family glycoside/pentoside/hexuronide:cation symporter
MADAVVATAPLERLPLSSKLAFGAGDLGPAIATNIASFFQHFFLTTVAGISPLAAGTILLVVKLWDSVNDPLMGWLTDKTVSRHGRRRPWLLYGAVPFGLLFFLQWLVPPLGDAGKIAYYLLIALLFDTAFTVVNVPYTALTPELTRDYDERTSLNSYRFAFSIGGSVVGGATPADRYQLLRRRQQLPAGRTARRLPGLGGDLGGVLRAALHLVLPGHPRAL